MLLLRIYIHMYINIHTYIQARTGETRVDEVGAYGVAGNSLERAFRCAESLSAFFRPSLFDNKQECRWKEIVW